MKSFVVLRSGRMTLSVDWGTEILLSYEDCADCPIISLPGDEKGSEFSVKITGLSV